MAEQPDRCVDSLQGVLDQGAGHALLAMGGVDQKTGQPLPMGHRLQAQGGDDPVMLGYPHLMGSPGAHGRLLAAIELVGQGAQVVG